ncbi:hypothetical protein ACL90Y_05460 [Micrococcus luteus]
MDADPVTATPARPLGTVLVTASLGLIAAALAWLTGTAALSLGSGTLNLGAQLFLVVLYLALTAWTAAVAVGVFRGRLWSRSATVAILVFAVLISTWIFTGGDVVPGLVLLAVAGVGLIAVLTRPVSDYFRARTEQPVRGAGGGV